jgi:photosystem II stability/assembly factor-like uncharacterized protein
MLSWAGALAGLAALLFALTGYGPLQRTMAASPVPVGITASGFDPAVVTITVGTTVVWTNLTQTTVHLVSGWPFHAYLPLALSGAGGGMAPGHGPLAHPQDSWADVHIAPGQSFSHTFTAAGTFRYYLAGRPTVTGTVIVTPSTSRWLSLPTGITETLDAVYFVDAQKGWVAGEDGAIHYTANGGQTWRRQSSGTDEDLDDLYFLDANRGWAVGGKGVILRTTDGGDTWEAQTSPRSTFLSSVQFTDDDHGWIGGGHYTLSGPPWTFRAYGYVISTTNGGDSWSLADYIYGRYVDKVTFVDRSNGWLVAEYVNNSTLETIPGIYRSSDGGASWSNQTIPLATGSLNAISFVDTSTGWAVGDGGAILNTTNGGQTWNQQTSSLTSTLEAVQFVNATTGWVVGSILHTTDGGQNWTPQAADAACIKLNDLHFIDADHGWVVGDDGVVCKYRD